MNKKSLGRESEIEVYCCGIFSFSNPAKLVWEINQNDTFQFERITDLCVIDATSKTKSYHTKFTFFFEDYGTKFILLKNKGTEMELLKTKIEIPYLLFSLAGEFKVGGMMLKQHLKTLQNVKAVQVLDSKLINKLAAYI
jgi:hypothetical protein